MTANDLDRWTEEVANEEMLDADNMKQIEESRMAARIQSTTHSGMACAKHKSSAVPIKKIELGPADEAGNDLAL